LRAYRTTDKRPAFHLESRPYDIGYNDLEDCRYRRLVLAGAAMLELILTPFQEGKRSGRALCSIQFLRCSKNTFTFLLSNKKSLSKISRTSSF